MVEGKLGSRGGKLILFMVDGFWVIFINLLCVNSVNILWKKGVSLYYFTASGTKTNED
jgi:hypothetical protein